jgi:hypothetical protein
VHVLLRPQWPGLPHERVMASLQRLTAEVLPALAASPTTGARP